LDAAGITKALRAKGIQEGDTVVIGDMEFEHSDDVSDGAMYEKWTSERRMAGIANKGSARWPHAGG
jgi:GTP-binding protein